MSSMKGNQFDVEELKPTGYNSSLSMNSVSSNLTYQTSKWMELFGRISLYIKL